MEPEVQKTIVFDALQSAAERILTGHFGSEVVIAQATLMTDPERRNRAWRCRLTATGAGIPETVVIKQACPDRYDPANVEAGGTDGFFNDWAGAQFLSEVAPEERHGPMFYGGDLDLGFIVLEDLGEHNSLVGPLLEGDADSATEALIAFTTRLGGMHASAMGKEAHYRAIRHNLSPDWAAKGLPSPEAQQESRDRRVRDFVELCGGLGIAVGEAAQQDLHTALKRVDEPGPFRTFVHCDPCPDNDFYLAPDLRLIDFEFSSFGHALRDGLYGRLPFPTCWCANTIPADVVQKMEAAYRAELAKICPEIAEEGRFLQEAAAIAAFWTQVTLQWHLKAALEEDGKWGIAGTRARILSRLLMVLDTARSADHIPALCEVYAALLAELQNRWPDATPLPLYPAFRKTDGTGV